MATAKGYSERIRLIFSEGSISETKKTSPMAELIIAIGFFLLDLMDYLGDLIAPIISSCIRKFRCANELDEFLAFANLDRVFDSGPVLAKSWNFRTKFFERLQRFDRGSTIIPPTKNSFLTPTSPQEHANPIQCQTFCCNGDTVHNQQTDPTGEPVDSPLHNQIGNASTSFGIEAGRDIEARGTSSNETSSSDADNETGNSSPGTGNQNPPPDDDDVIDETPPTDGVNLTSSNYDYKGKNELEFVFMVGGQTIATVIAAFSLKNTSDVSTEAMVLQHIVLGCMFVSLTSLFYGLLLSVYKPRSLATRVVRVIGYTAMALTLLITTGLNLPNKLMIGVTAVLCTLCLPAVIFYAANPGSAGL
ncbi:uncharacterized protein LOC123220086 [Mangifera indica]|uniref:uncharacterized protein LOC123220086 n=1 Tax=Mangifera indica TaxID=29780 RepID=UPI001CF937DF|nr:uncharacterized protein LOC123220086 [Mangifera indica]